MNRYLLVFLLFAFHAPAWGDLDRLVQKSGLKDEVGLFVGETSSRRALYNHNSERAMIPASLSKVMTAAASLQAFGPAHRFKTELRSSALIQDGVLKGDLYIVGGGDPSFTSEVLWNLVNSFTRNEIHRIEGDIVVDDFLFDQVRFDPSRRDDWGDRAYEAPVGALSFNWNTVGIFIRPSSRGEAPKVFLDPVSSLSVVNRAKTVRGKRQSLQVRRVGKRIEISGSLGDQVDEAAFYRNIPRPDFWSAQALKDFLKQREIEVLGGIRKGQAAGQKTLASVQGKTIREIVTDMMKFSNNFVAEMMAKNLSARISSEPATMKNGVTEIKGFMEHHGFRSGNYSFTNPSGLSRDNRFRPVDLYDFLYSLERSFVYFPELLTSHPISGVDGTLVKRIGSPLVRAKTGTLSGVIGLAGLIRRPGQSPLIFAFIFNGQRKDHQKAKNLFDSLVLSILGQSLQDLGEDLPRLL